MATHTSIIAWRMVWAEDPGRLQSMGLQRIGHERATNTFISVELRNKSRQLILNLCIKIVHKRKTVSSANGLGKPDAHMPQNEDGALPHIKEN